MSRMGCYVKWREAERPFERGNRPLMSRQRAGTYVFALVVVARTDRWWGIEARSGRNLTTAPRPVIRIRVLAIIAISTPSSERPVSAARGAVGRGRARHVD